MEKNIERNFVVNLANQGYNIRYDISNENDLKVNMKEKLEIFNNVKLENEEFEEMYDILSSKSVSDLYQILRSGGEVRSGKLVNFVDFSNYKNNIYEVVTQLRMVNKKSGIRSVYDVVILLNGIPVVQIELKRPNVDILDAFNQIRRYKLDLSTDIMNFVQFFVISNDYQTRYFANSDVELRSKFVFKFKNTNGYTVQKVEDIAKYMLSPKKLIEMLHENMAFNHSTGRVVVLKSHQINGKNAALKRVLEEEKDGFVWHATGSGKTLTSFKLSRILSERDDVEKVVFLVDRKDLDDQTIRTFNRFKKGCVDYTESTDVLREQLTDIGNKLIVTTIQKMNNVIVSSPELVEKHYGKRYIFVVDECHRTQCGLMHENIRAAFPYSQFVGFTGTPLFNENTSKEKYKTENIFGDCVHQYLMKDAIKDGNTLPFNVEYYRTMKMKDDVEDEKVYGIKKKEVLLSDERLECIVDDILKIHKKKTLNKKYSAILATSEVRAAIKYWDIFKRKNHDLNIGILFSDPGDNEFYDDIPIKNKQREMYEDVLRNLGMKNVEKISNEEYRDIVSNRLKSVNIDILIVVNMLLTGFDAVNVNTLYVDKNLYYHNLVQAISRTNRVDPFSDLKSAGNIVFYRDAKKNVINSLALFNGGYNKVQFALDLTDDEILTMINDEIDVMKKLVPEPTTENINKLKKDEDKKAFINTVKKISSLLNKAEQSSTFKSEKVNIFPEDMEEYKRHYLNMYETTKRVASSGEKSVLSDIDFSIELIADDQYIDYNYILAVLSDKAEKDKKKMISLIHQSNDPKVVSKKDLLISFIKSVDFNDTDDVQDLLDHYSKSKLLDDIDSFVNKYKIDNDFIVSQIASIRANDVLDERSINVYVNNLEGFSDEEKSKVHSAIKDFILKSNSQYLM